MTPKEFIARYAAFAQQSQKATGVPASFSLAQAALETGWGKSAIGNNLFGIKVTGGWTGQYQLVATTEWHDDDKHKYPLIIKIEKIGNRFRYTVKDYFRDYASPAESFEDHAKFLVGNPRYRPAFQFTNDGEKFSEAVAEAGYATGPGYATQLIAIIRQHNLAQFDLAQFDNA